MIIKSLSRKSRSSRPGARGGLTPFSSLVRYMNRGIKEEEGQAVLWHNFYGDERSREEDLVEEFERNAARLRERSNGNVLYHEILSFSRGYKLKEDALIRAVADIGQEYLNERAPRQLAYGVIHRDTDHIHLHLMVSSNAVGKSERVRLSKKEFADIQKRVEQFALERFPELNQSKIYGRPRAPERLKTDAREQAMKTRVREPSRKEVLKAKLHSLFERATNFAELAGLAEKEGVSFYQRGKAVGVIVRDGDGTERKHRLSTLGLEPHYELTNARLGAAAKSPEKPRQAEKPAPEPEKAAPRPKPAPERVPRRDREEGKGTPAQPATTPLEREIEDILSKVPGVRGAVPPQEGPPKDAPDRAKAPPERDRGDDR